MKFDLTIPCRDCPFRTDRDVFLNYERAEEIAHCLIEEQGTFTCHKMDRGDYLEKQGEKQHCAGALIMLEHMQRSNQMMRWMERLGDYNYKNLKMNAPVYKSTDEFVQAHLPRRNDH